MPSPVAHVGLTVAAWVACRPPGSPLFDRATACVAMASVGPDVDLAVCAITGNIDWHRGPTHSLVGAGLLAALVAVAGRKLPRLSSGDATISNGAILATVLAGLSHVLFDWATGEPGAAASFGVPWAWPFSATKAIAARPFFGVYHIHKAGFLANLFVDDAWPAWRWEFETVAVAIGLSLAIRYVRRRL